MYTEHNESRHSVVSIATRYKMDGPKIESWWGRHFPHLGPIQPPVQWVPSLSRGGKAAEARRGVNHPPPSSATVKERVELYLCFSSSPSWPVLGRNLSLHYTEIKA